MAKTGGKRSIPPAKKFSSAKPKLKNTINPDSIGMPTLLGGLAKPIPKKK